MMKSTNPTLILVLGMPATGKTHLSKEIANSLALPLVSKDDIKEIMFEGLGWSDREYSKKIGKTSFAILDYFIETQLAAGNSIILESPLKPEFENDKFRKWQQKYKCKTIQVLCYANGEVLVRRFVERAQSGARHPGHRDDSSLDEFRDDLLKGRAKLLDIEGDVIEVDTTDFSSIDYSKISSQIARIIAG